MSGHLTHVTAVYAHSISIGDFVSYGDGESRVSNIFALSKGRKLVLLENEGTFVLGAATPLIVRRVNAVEIAV